MPSYTSGYFLEIFLGGEVVNHKDEVDRYKKEVIERLRGLENEYSEIEIWPKLGVSNFIQVTTKDSLSSNDWQKIKA